MGIEANMLSFSYKNNPLKLNIRGLADYQITGLQVNDTMTSTAKSLALGFGWGIELKRYNNFSFVYKMDWTWHNFKDFNTFESISDFPEERIPVFHNQAEISYHPNKNPNQAIFVRLNTYGYMGNSDNSAFYQFQFGYKFSLGSRAITK
ncbi:MAG: hypothetical protein GKR88_12855 [Flavobacteriaceae bacterium]|nr:MAG: hypothetical protein GKR88_12855 [Flavobacteriaceae bacterium]